MRQNIRIDAYYFISLHWRGITKSKFSMSPYALLSTRAQDTQDLAFQDPTLPLENCSSFVVCGRVVSGGGGVVGGGGGAGGWKGE